MKFFFNLVKWVMLFAGIALFVDAQMKISAMEKSRETGMADVIIDPATSGYFSIYDNCDKTRIISFKLDQPRFFNLFNEGKIRLYLKKGDTWKEMRPTNSRNQPFSLVRGHVGDGNPITMKYEADLRGDNDYLITLSPIRLTNNLEVFELLPQVFWGILLIAGAFLGECICRLIIFICKKLKTRERDNSEEVGDVEYYI